MGNLFTSEETRRREATEYLRNQSEQMQRLQYERLRVQREQLRVQQEEARQQAERQRQLTEQRLSSYIASTRLLASTYHEQQNATVMVNYVINHNETASWAPMTSNEIVKYVRLSAHSQEYKTIERLFTSTNKKYFKVSHIERIQNPYLFGAYLLKKEEMLNKFNKSTQEHLLFHGTKEKNIINICEDNFDWRKHGAGTGHRFGKGVSFSPISNYATHYCDKASNIKVMLVVKVLISRACTGNPELIVPPEGYDTTQKDNGHVIVKYDDNEFYPAYKLFYTVGNSFKKTVVDYDFSYD